MEQTTNGLKNFLKSEKVILSPEKYIPEKIFKRAFNDHCKENNIHKEAWNADYYSNIFSTLKIYVKKATKRKYPVKYGESIYGTFFIGVDLTNKDNQSDNEVEVG